VKCAAGLVCSDPGATDGVCALLPGQSCQADPDCAPGERCADARVCRTPAALGNPCDAGTPCPSGAVCDASICRQVVGAGEICPDEFTVCATGLACLAGIHPGHGTCQPPPAAGQPCDLNGRCADGLGCAWQPFAPGYCEPSVCLSRVAQ
jgi:hypothetical protein